jgi:hypothetical protein
MDGTRPPGEYQWQAMRKCAGLSVTSAPVKVTVLVNNPPYVSILSPSSGNKFSTVESIPITVSATDEVQVVKVEFYANNNLLGQDDVEPFQFNWTPSSSGIWSITAVATDISGQKSTSATVNVTIVSGSNYGGCL